jgi:AbrB family looped-hinge helix DNA binding protein
METKLSTKGQVVLPGPIRRKLGLRPGDSFDAEAQGGRVILTPRKKRIRKARIVTDKITGLPALDAGPDVAPLTHKQVREILDEFP